MSLQNKVVLVTGGAGSFGQKLAEMVLRMWLARLQAVPHEGQGSAGK